MHDEFLLLDSQLLVLLVVGLTDKRIISKHKRTRQFLTEDFDLLIRLIGAKALLLTPNTVTEASNHLMWHGQPERDRIAQKLRDVVEAYGEDYVPSRRGCDRREYVRLGIADAVLLARATECAAILTSDAGLYVAAMSAHIRVVNFNHEREAAGLL